MPYEILIRRNSTGEVRVCEFSNEDEWWDADERMWLRGVGNYGLDVNRHLMFCDDETERDTTWPVDQVCDYDAFVRWRGGRIHALDHRPPGRARKDWPPFAFKPLEVRRLPHFGTTFPQGATS